MHKRRDPWQLLFLTIASILLMLLGLRWYLTFAVVVILLAVAPIGYYWYVVKYLPRKRLLDQADAHKPFDFPERGGTECPQVGNAGYHSEDYYEGGSCKWCGAKGPDLQPDK